MRAFFLSFVLCCAAAWGVSPDALKLDSPVVDQAGVIDAAQETELAQLLRDWQAQGLMQGAVVLVDSTDGMDDFDYAMRVAERWGLGSRERDNGLLLFLAVKERKVRMLTGTGIEGALPDISAAKIIREQIVPNLRAGDFAGAMRQGLQAAALRLQSDPAAQAEMVAQDRGGSLFDMPSFRAPSHESPEFTRLLTWLFFGAIITQVVSTIARKSTWARVLHGTLFGSVFGGVFGAGFSQAANIAWLMPLFLVGGAVLFGLMAYLRPKPKRVRRRDDDDDNSGFWGGFGSSSGGFGGDFGGGSSSGGYSGGGGSFSGGGAGSSW